MVGSQLETINKKKRGDRMKNNLGLDEAIRQVKNASNFRNDVFKAKATKIICKPKDECLVRRILNDNH